MPTVFAHAAVAATFARIYSRERRMPARLWLLAIVCAVAPDLDSVLGIPGVDLWNDLFAHRGFTHSLTFAALLAALVMAAAFRDIAVNTRAWWRHWLFFFAVTASHGVLDALTSGGPGVAFFSPFSRETYFFPWRPIAVSPLRLSFFSARGVAAVMSELLWIGAPIALVLGVRALWRYRAVRARHRQ